MGWLEVAKIDILVLIGYLLIGEGEHSEGRVKYFLHKQITSLFLILVTFTTIVRAWAFHNTVYNSELLSCTYINFEQIAGNCCTFNNDLFYVFFMLFWRLSRERIFVFDKIVHVKIFHIVCILGQFHSEQQVSHFLKPLIWKLLWKL